MSSLFNIILPLLGYTLLTGLYTYPWSTHLLTQLPAGGDGLVFVWWFSHIRGALLGQHGLYYSNYVFYPLDNVFLPSYISFPIAIIAMGVPIAFLLGDVVAYNACTYLSFVLTGYGTYLLCRYLTRNRLASFLAGCIPAFAPFRYVSFIQGQLEAMSIQWFPFLILFCFRWKDQPTMRNALGLGFFAALVVLTSPYYVFVLLLFLALFVALHWQEITRPSMLRPAVYALAVSAFFALPFYLPLLWHNLGSGVGGRSLQEFDFYSADFLSFFLPASFHPFLGDLTNRVYHDHVIGTIQSYAGISVLLVAFWAVVVQRLSATRFFLFVLSVFFILSLGSSLHMGRLRIHFGLDQGFIGVPAGTPLEWQGPHHPVLLPFYFLHKYVPFFSMLRYPTRFQIIFILALGVLYANGLTFMMRALTSKVRIAAVGVAALTLLGFEYLHPPVAMYHHPVPDFYRALGRQSGDFAILQIPIGPDSGYLFYQTIHGKKIMTGYMSTPVPTFIRLVQQTPFLYAATNAELPGQWGWGNPPYKTLLDEAEMGRTIEKLKTWKVQYLVYHRQLVPVRDETIPKFFELLAKDNRAFYQDGSIVVIKPEDLRFFSDFLNRELLLRLPPIRIPRERSFVGDTIFFNDNSLAEFSNWYDAEPTHRWAYGNIGSIVLHVGNVNPEAKQYVLILKGFTLEKQTVEIRLNNILISTFANDGSKQTWKIPFEAKLLNPNAVNMIEFRIPGARKPGSKDERILGFAFQELLFTSKSKER